MGRSTCRKTGLCDTPAAASGAKGSHYPGARSPTYTGGCQLRALLGTKCVQSLGELRWHQ